MENPKNRFKQAIRAGKPQIGLWGSIPSHYSAEVVAGAGFDWFLIDTEHTPADIETVFHQLQAVAAYPTTPIVRVPWNDMVVIKRFLDLGVQSLLIPQVTTVEEAKNAVAYARYPTAGVRGVAGTTRATRFGRIKDYFRQADAEICVLIQLETEAALKNIDAVAAIDGVDGIFIGPADLHASIGHLGDVAHEKVMPVIDDAIVRIARTGKAPGILTSSEEHARRWLKLGALFVAVGSDVGLLARGTDALVAKFKS
ncbi:MAG TPA: HpcH/HpaI aldolase/citrate lyase family protein [Xanthobacteraceae bacterium]|jgi:4-hydroxy-2-oxoheptanedioate aldolase